MALKGIKIIEFAGLAPTPLCGMILSDFGATVTVIDRNPDNHMDVLAKGKRSIAVNIKNPKSKDLIRRMCKISDVLIEPYRPGVMEKLGLGPNILLADNPRLIYARLTGFGQTGPLAHRAGHDINYVAISGILSLLGRKEGKPTPPVNLLADMAGGGLMCAFGILAALVERNQSGQGQIVDNSMVEGTMYVSSWLTRSQHLPVWGEKRGENILDSNAFFYDTYETKDGKYMSVGALERQFFRAFVDALGVPHLQQYGDNEESKLLVTQKFLTKTQNEWSEIFEKIDACVFPVLDWKDADQHRQNKYRQSFADKSDVNGSVVPMPAPKLSRTPASSSALNQPISTVEILKEIGMLDEEIKQMQEDGSLILPTLNCKL